MSSTNTSTNLAISGLASGFDWQSLVTQLIQVERAPETQLKSHQSTLQQKNNVYQSIGTQLGTLSNAVKTLMDPGFFDSRQATLSDSTVASASADAGTPLGSYTFNFSQLATSAVQQGSLNGGKPLSSSSDVSGLALATAGFVTPITAGTFTVDGKTITIATTDTLQSVFDQIKSATGNNVTGGYDPATDTISLTSADNSPIVLGSATDTSNFLQAAKLYNNGTKTVTSTSALGGVQLTGAMSNANLVTAVTGDSGGNGSFSINGVTVNYNLNNDSVSDVLTRINNSTAGVTATYDTINDRFLLTNKTTGDVGITLQNITGNFLDATGLSAAGGGALQRGKNLLYTINGGGTLTSQSNTITSASSGLTGLTVTALKQNASTVVTVNSDTSTISNAISNFVTQYNAAQNFINSQTTSTTDSTGKVTASLLTGDSDANNLETQLRQLTMASPFGSNAGVNNLNGLGIVSNGNDNTISLSDSSALNNALTNNLQAVKNLFTDSTNGIATKLNAYLTAATGDSGILQTKEKDFTQQSQDIDNTIAAMERKITDDQSRLTSEFQAMETAQAQINQQQQYLTQTFGGSSSKTG